MRPINITKITWFLFRNLSPWEIHERKQLLRKVVNVLIIAIYVVVGIFIFLNETGRLNFMNSKSQVGSIKGGPASSDNNITFISEKDSLSKGVQALEAISANPLTDTSMLDGRLKKNSGDSMMSIVHVELASKKDSLSVGADICSIIIEKPKPKQVSGSQDYWYSPLVDLAYADKLRSSYSGCVMEHLEQPYASVALAISAIIAYQDKGQNGFNFLGEKVWDKKEFNNASEYFKEFSLIFNPADIEDKYFDKYQGKKVPLSEQYWRAYVEKFFPDVQPKTVRDLMQRWGFRYTEIK